MNTKARHIGHLIILALALCLTMACSEKSDDAPVKPDTPTTPSTPTGNKFTVPAQGGTVTTGDIAIVIPSGTFSKETQIWVEEVTSGSVRGEDEVSKFYKLTLPVTTKKPMKVTIKCSTPADDVFLVAHAPVIGLSNWEEGYGDVPIEATYNNGEYTAELPAFENGESTETNSFSVGLARVVRDANTRAANDHQVGNISWHINKTHRFNIANATGDLEAALHQYIREAITILHGLGFKVSGTRDIPFEFAILDKGEYGQFCQSAVKDSWSVIKLSEKLVTESSVDNVDLKQTVIHELMHYFQSDYDTRWPCTKYRYVSGDELMMYECGGVWVEKFMNDGKPSSEFVKTYIYSFTQGLHGYLSEIYSGLSEGVRHQQHGYAMSSLLEYLSQEFGDDKIVQLYEMWRESKGGRDTFYNLSSFATANHSMLFTFDYYDDFILALCQGQVSWAESMQQNFFNPATEHS